MRLGNESVAARGESEKQIPFGDDNQNTGMTTKKGPGMT
jgi:hypothetical protein